MNDTLIFNAILILGSPALITLWLLGDYMINDTSVKGNINGFLSKRLMNLINKRRYYEAIQFLLKHPNAKLSAGMWKKINPGKEQIFMESLYVYLKTAIPKNQEQSYTVVNKTQLKKQIVNLFLIYGEKYTDKDVENLKNYCKNKRSTGKNRIFDEEVNLYLLYLELTDRKVIPKGDRSDFKFLKEIQKEDSLWYMDDNDFYKKMDNLAFNLYPEHYEKLCGTWVKSWIHDMKERRTETGDLNDILRFHPFIQIEN